MDTFQFLYFDFKMDQFELQKLLEENLTLETQLSQRIDSLQIHMTLVNGQQQIIQFINELLIAQNDCRNMQASNLLNLQQRLLLKTERLELIARYEKTIEDLMFLLNSKQEQIAIYQSEGKSIKIISVSIKKTSQMHENYSEIAALMKELRLKTQLEKQIAELQSNEIEKQDQKQNIANLQIIFLQQFMNQQIKNKNLKATLVQLQQFHTKVLNESSNDGNVKQQLKSAKTISQTSDQD